MKIRTDFVTNSSSSSFCTIRISGKEILGIINKYKHLFNDEKHISIDDKMFVYNDQEETAVEAWPPEKKNKIIKAIRDFFSEFPDPLWSASDLKELKKMDKELRANEAQIMESLTLLEWEFKRAEWGEFAEEGGMCST